MSLNDHLGIPLDLVHSETLLFKYFVFCLMEKVYIVTSGSHMSAIKANYSITSIARTRIAQENKYLEIFFLFYHGIVCCVYSLESPLRGDSNEYTQHTIIV